MTLVVVLAIMPLQTIFSCYFVENQILSIFYFVGRWASQWVWWNVALKIIWSSVGFYSEASTEQIWHSLILSILCICRLQWDIFMSVCVKRIVSHFLKTFKNTFAYTFNLTLESKHLSMSELKSYNEAEAYTRGCTRRTSCRLMCARMKRPWWLFQANMICLYKPVKLTSKGKIFHQLTAYMIFHQHLGTYLLLNIPVNMWCWENKLNFVMSWFSEGGTAPLT